LEEKTVTHPDIHTDTQLISSSVNLVKRSAVDLINNQPSFHFLLSDKAYLPRVRLMGTVNKYRYAPTRRLQLAQTLHVNRRRIYDANMTADRRTRDGYASISLH